MTGRELEVLELLAQGRSTQEVADTLGISVLTVRGHVRRVLVKLGVHSRLEAVAFALRRGLIQTD
jgi:DNA-binding CsgD family transcriptional regulator